MNPQLFHLGSAFYIAAAIIGLPAVVFLLFDGVRRLRAKFSPKIDSSFPVKNPDAILLMLGGITKGVTTLASIMGFFGSILANVLVVASVAALGSSTILFFTARGLQAGQMWARVVAGVIAAGLLAIALIAIASPTARQKGRIILPLLLGLVSLWVLRVVWKG